MTVTIPIAGSVWPKVFGVLGILAAGLSVAYTNSFVQVAGLPAYAFFSALSLAFNSAGTFVSRQDNRSSEEVGAGNHPENAQNAIPTQAEIDAFKSQLAEMAKKLEDKK